MWLPKSDSSRPSFQLPLQETFSPIARSCLILCAHRQRLLTEWLRMLLTKHVVSPKRSGLLPQCCALTPCLEPSRMLQGWLLDP